MRERSQDGRIGRAAPRSACAAGVEDSRFVRIALLAEFERAESVPQPGASEIREAGIGEVLEAVDLDLDHELRVFAEQISFNLAAIIESNRQSH